MTNRNKVLFFGILSNVILLDQSSKYIAEVYCSGRVLVLNRWISFILSHNTGCAWGIFRNNAITLGILGVVMLIVFYFYRHKIGIYRCPVVFALFFGGTLGNVIDRLCRGYVVDFIDINLQFYNWPTFNFADAAMCTAVFLSIFPQKSKIVRA